MSRAPRFDVVLREYLVEIFVPHPARGAEASELTRNWKDAATSADLRSVGRSALLQSLRALSAPFDDAGCQGLDYLTSEPLGDGAFHDSLGSFGNSRKKRLQTFENVLLRYPGRTRERHPIRARDTSCEILPPNPHRHLDLMESSVGIGQVAIGVPVEIQTAGQPDRVLLRELTDRNIIAPVPPLQQSGRTVILDRLPRSR